MAVYYYEQPALLQPADSISKVAAVTETEFSRSNSDTSSDNGSILPRHIIASPYTDSEHHLDLDTLADDVAPLASALTQMHAVRDDYATAPYHQSFNWDTIVSTYLRTLREDASTIRFFVIVFRSRLKVDADRPTLGLLDKAAHLEAIQAGGLLKYWFGSPDINRRNLATCLWRERADARHGGAGPGHAAAMTAARRMYDEWFVERLELSIDPSDGSWKFGPWPDAE